MRARGTINGGWITHSVGTLTGMIKHDLKKFHNVTILEYKHGFFPFGSKFSELHRLFEVDMGAIQFNLSDVFALHFFNQASHEYQNLFKNQTWLFKTSSTAATAIRMILPTDFNFTDLDENICTSS